MHLFSCDTWLQNVLCPTVVSTTVVYLRCTVLLEPLSAKFRKLHDSPFPFIFDVSSTIKRDSSETFYKTFRDVLGTRRSIKND